MPRQSPAAKYAINREAMQMALSTGCSMADAVRQVRTDRLLERLRQHDIARSARRDREERVREAYQKQPYWMEN